VLVIFDTETTSLYGDVVELGSIILTDSGKRFIFNERCKPVEPIHPKAQAVHGISDADLAGCRTSETVVMEWLQDIKDLALQEHEEFVLCAHNLAFDTRMVSRHIDLVGTKKFCSLNLTRRIFPDITSKSLEPLYAYLGFTEVVKAHSAIDDCLMVERVLPKLTSNYYHEAMFQKERIEAEEREEAIKSATPAKMLKVVEFGTKNKGKLFTDVSQRDLLWMYENMLNNKDVVYTAGVLLGKQ